jgi:hypothetical protein
VIFALLFVWDLVLTKWIFRLDRATKHPGVSFPGLHIDYLAPSTTITADISPNTIDSTNTGECKPNSSKETQISFGTQKTADIYSLSTSELDLEVVSTTSEGSSSTIASTMTSQPSTPTGCCFPSILLVINFNKYIFFLIGSNIQARICRKYNTKNKTPLWKGFS